MIIFTFDLLLLFFYRTKSGPQNQKISDMYRKDTIKMITFHLADSVHNFIKIPYLLSEKHCEYLLLNIFIYNINHVKFTINVCKISGSNVRNTNLWELLFLCQ